MDTQNLVGENGGAERIRCPKIRNVYQGYLFKKLTWIGIILGLPTAVALCTIQILLMVTFISTEKYFYQAEFEYSGFGIIAAVTYLVASIFTIRNLWKPTYSKLWLTLVAQGISFGVHVGLIVLAVSALMQIRYDQDGKEDLLRCNCLDNAGNVGRNGTYPESWACKEKKPITCAVVDVKVKDLDWKSSLLWTMIASAGFQCMWSALLLLASVRTLICVGDAFDKVAGAKQENETDSAKQNAYAKWFPTKVIYIIGWIQFGLAMLNILLSMCASGWDRGGAGLDLFQFCTVGSFALLNWMSTMNFGLTYYSLTGLGVLHLLSIGAMIGSCVAMGGLILYPFAAIGMILSLFIVFVSFRPIVKVDEGLMNLTQD